VVGGQRKATEMLEGSGSARMLAGGRELEMQAVFLLEGGGSARMLTGGGEPEMQALYFCRGEGEGVHMKLRLPPICLKMIPSWCWA